MTPPAQQPVSTFVVSEEHKVLFSAFVASYEALTIGNPAPPALMEEDLSQIDDDDLEEMDIKWQMAMIAVRAKKFFRKTGRNQFRNSSNSKLSFDKSKARCYNYQQLSHFKRECTTPPAAPQDQTSHQNVKPSIPSTSNSTALVS